MNTKINEKEIELIANDEMFCPVIINGEPYNDYWISNYGRCYSEKTCKFIKPRIRKKGDEFNFYNNGKSKSISPNKLIRLTFGETKKYPELIADDETFRQATYKGENFEGYLVSNYGRVWSNKSNGILKMQTNNESFASCSMLVDGKIRHVFVHYLVAYAFIPNPDGLSKVHHSDGNRGNNRAANLVWRNGNPLKSYENADFDITKIDLVADDEIFKPLQIDNKYYSDYYISNYGRCYHVEKHKILKPFIDKFGFAYYRLCLDDNKDKMKDARAHILVALAFVDNKNNHYKKVKHLDGNKLNNKFDNLQWCKDNATYKQFDDTVDIGDIELFAPDERFAVAKTDKEVFGAYLISNYGRLYSKHTNKIMKGIVDYQGYQKYCFGKGKLISAHRLVCFSFVENPNVIDFNMVNHRDERKDSNYFKNLEWCDNQYNLNYNKTDTWAERTAPKPVLKRDENNMVVKKYDSILQAAKNENVGFTTMRGWCNTDKMHRGYYWEYA